jgi:hypothetical protein
MFNCHVIERFAQGGKEEKFSVWFKRLALYAFFEARIELDGH